MKDTCLQGVELLVHFIHHTDDDEFIYIKFITHHRLISILH